jgi:hypothetical protein
MVSGALTVTAAAETCVVLPGRNRLACAVFKFKSNPTLKTPSEFGLISRPVATISGALRDKALYTRPVAPIY